MIETLDFVLITKWKWTHNASCERLCDATNTPCDALRVNKSVAKCR